MKLEDIVIDDKLHDPLPKLSGDELDKLRQEVLDHGVREPLVIWSGKGVLLDGRSRHTVCTEEGIDDVPTVEYHFPSRETAQQWVWRNQLGRRNLNPKLTSELRGKLLKAEEKLAEGILGQNDPKIRKRGRPTSVKASAVQRVAEETGTSPSTIKRDDKFDSAMSRLDNFNGKFAHDVRNNAVKVSKADVEKMANLEDKELAKAIQNIRQGKRFNGKPSGGGTFETSEWEGKSGKPSRKSSRKPSRATLAKEVGKAYSALVRSLDVFGKGIDEQNGDRHKACLAGLDEFFSDWEVWRDGK